MVVQQEFTLDFTTRLPGLLLSQPPLDDDLSSKEALGAVSGPKFLRPAFPSFQGFLLSDGQKGGTGKREKEIKLLLN